MQESKRPAAKGAVMLSPIYSAHDHAAVRTSEYLFHQLIPYLGNKRKLLPLIAQAVERTGTRAGTFVDFFAGSGVVSRWAKQAGFRVIANDWEPYARIVNQCAVQCNSAPPFAAFGGMPQAFDLLNGLPPVVGYITSHLCPTDDHAPDPENERLFFTRANGMRIDAMRDEIRQWEAEGRLSADEKVVLLASLIYAVSYVSNTSGVFKGFHHGWGGRTGTALYRILSRLHVCPPLLYDNGRDNQAAQVDAQTLAEQLRGNGSVDIAYLDPPYNQHPYGSNYHVLNTVALGDRPPVSPVGSRGGKSAIRTDWRTERRSAYNHRASALAAYTRLLETLDARHILTSYSTDGTIFLPDLLNAAARHGRLECVWNPYKRYRVSAQRRSAKPLNIEFVLIVDTARSAVPHEAERIYEMLTRTESEALARHQESTLPKGCPAGVPGPPG